MSNPTTQPSRPAPTVLRQIRSGRLPAYVARDQSGRFTIERNDTIRGADGRVVIPFEDSGYTIRDTAHANLLGWDRNWVIVFELDDVRWMIDRVLYREYLTALAKWQDAERVRLGLPTVLEEARARAADQTRRTRQAV